MGDCCSTCNGEKEKSTEVTMKGLGEKRYIMVVDVEDDDNVIEKYDSQVAMKNKRRSDIRKELEIE